MIRAALAVLLALCPATGWAHGTGSRVASERAIVLNLHYSDGDAMAYVDVQVFAPSETVAFLHARADRLGRAAFVPDRDGDWWVEARDAEGHTVRTMIPVSGLKAVSESGGVPAAWLWGSLALNLFGLAQFVSRYRAGRAAPAGLSVSAKSA